MLAGFEVPLVENYLVTNLVNVVLAQLFRIKGFLTIHYPVEFFYISITGKDLFLDTVIVERAFFCDDFAFFQFDSEMLSYCGAFIFDFLIALVYGLDIITLLLICGVIALGMSVSAFLIDMI